jgi:hypothetical protein
LGDARLNRVSSILLDEPTEHRDLGHDDRILCRAGGLFVRMHQLGWFRRWYWSEIGDGGRDMFFALGDLHLRHGKFHSILVK